MIWYFQIRILKFELNREFTFINIISLNSLTNYHLRLEIAMLVYAKSMQINHITGLSGILFCIDY